MDEAGLANKGVIASYLDLRSRRKPLSHEGVNNHIELIDAREVQTRGCAMEFMYAAPCLHEPFPHVSRSQRPSEAKVGQLTS